MQSYSLDLVPLSLEIYDGRKVFFFTFLFTPKCGGVAFYIAEESKIDEGVFLLLLFDWFGNKKGQWGTLRERDDGGP